MKHSILILLAVNLIACVPAQEFNLADKLAQDKIVVSLLDRTVDVLRSNEATAIEQAAQILEVAREINPRDPRILDGLGSIEFRRANYQLAKYFFKQAIKENPAYDRPYLHLAMIARMEGDNLAAYDLLSMAIQLNPLNSKARLEMAYVLADSGQYEQAQIQQMRAMAAVNLN